MTAISDIGSVRTLVGVALDKGIADVLISPGSRNAPFIISFAAMPAFRCLSILDERTAAFVALGMAQQRNTPVILCCTSGSAMLNYAPALAEAYYQRIPLIAITADRPREWIDQGEGQSIHQTTLLGGVMVRSVELVNERTEDDRWYNTRLVNEAVETAILSSRPVHINVPLNEPLYGQAPTDNAQVFRNFKTVTGQAKLVHAEESLLRGIWNQSQKILILAGQRHTDSALLEQLKQLDHDGRVVVLTETPANMHYRNFVACVDRTMEAFLGTDKEGDFVPDLLITLGENFISKKLKAWLRRNRTSVLNHWHFGPEPTDTFQCLTHHVTADPAGVLAHVRTAAPEGADTSYNALWRGLYYKAEALHQDFVAGAPYSDLVVYDRIFQFLPDDWQVQMGNSSVVRYVQLFSPIEQVRYFGNRGVSGIEGCTSTAVGAARASESPVLLLSGDHAFRYDSNGLSVKPLPDNLRIIVINNGGGNIFRIIEGPTDNALNEQFIEVVNESSIEGLVRYHGADYLRAANTGELEEALEAMVSSATSRCTVLEVFTPRTENPEILKNYFKHLRNGTA